jgi:acetyl esterase/lipase
MSQLRPETRRLVTGRALRLVRGGGLVIATVLLGILAYLAGQGHTPVPAATRTTDACRGTNPSVAVPKGPHGLFVADANLFTRAETEVIDRYLPADPTVCGANLVVPWSAVDRGPNHNPRYNWRFIDNAAQPWIASGKMVNLIVWGVAENTREPFGATVTPAYVLRSVDTVTCPGPHQPATPVYWEPGYRDNYRAFMRAVVRRYGHVRSVGYIRFGIGAGDEDYPGNDLQGACLQAWRARGLSAQGWLAYSLSTIQFEAGLHSSKQIMVGVNRIGHDLTLPHAVAAVAARARIGFGIQELDQAAIRQDRQGTHCYADWCALFQMYAGAVPLEAQTFAPSRPDGSGPVGALPPLLSLALQKQAQIIELYPQEWLIADDPGRPAYGAYHAVYRRALRMAANLVASSIRIVRDVPYVQPASVTRSGDLYLPTGHRSHFAIILIHGGGWHSGSKDDPTSVFLAWRLAEEGDAVFNINYRLVGRGGEFPNDVQDVKDALAFLAANASKWSIDPYRLAVVGTSSGAHLALLAAYAPSVGVFAPPHYPGSNVHVAAVGDFFGPADLGAFPRSAAPGVIATVARYLGARYDRNPAIYREASPVTYIDHAVPTILEHGTADGVVPFAQSVELDRLLSTHDVRHEFVSVPGGTHGLSLGWPGNARDVKITRLTDFLDRILSAS